MAMTMVMVMMMVGGDDDDDDDDDDDVDDDDDDDADKSWVKSTHSSGSLLVGVAVVPRVRTAASCPQTACTGLWLTSPERTCFSRAQRRSASARTPFRSDISRELW